MIKNPFEISPDEVRLMSRQLADWLVDYFGSVRQARVHPGVPADELWERLQEPLPEEPQPWDRIFAEFREKIVPNSRHNSHPRFYGYISGPSTPVAAIADALASAINQNLTAWRSAPAATEIERLVVDWLRQLVGLPEPWGGYLTSGGSLANLSALAVARCAKFPGDVRGEGLQSMPGAGRMLVYASSEVHGSIQKAADLLGLGQRQVRLIPVDDQLRIRVDLLQRTLREDRENGHLPFCLVANGGSVNTGAVDPLVELAELSRRENLWLHIDGAYGALAAMAPAGRQALGPLDQADSLSMDPHKWLYVPMDAGCVLFRNPLQAREAFGYSADYMRVNQAPETREGFAFFDYGPELSRRFRALRIWVSLKFFGSRAVAGQIENNIRVAAYLQQQVRGSADFQLLAPGPLSIACFRYIPESLRKSGPSAEWVYSESGEAELNALNAELLSRLQQGGRFYPSGTRIRGREAIRVCIVNYLAAEPDMDALLEEIRNLAARPGAGRRPAF